MDRWTRRDITGPSRARRVLDQCGRLVNHGHKSEALDKIVGAVACGFVAPTTVAKTLGISADELNAAVDLYRQGEPEEKPAEAESDDDRAAGILFKAISRAGGLGNARKVARKMVETLKEAGLMQPAVTFSWKPEQPATSNTRTNDNGR
ncbi:MAG: hypothetical protein GEU95_10385 [Rhizobiales bacterium]|nr:hypothetical protein [Hyphomicrobiales bacterium]